MATNSHDIYLNLPFKNYLFVSIGKYPLHPVLFVLSVLKYLDFVYFNGWESSSNDSVSVRSKWMWRLFCKPICPIHWKERNDTKEWLIHEWLSSLVRSTKVWTTHNCWNIHWETISQVSQSTYVVCVQLYKCRHTVCIGPEKNAVWLESKQTTNTTIFLWLSDVVWWSTKHFHSVRNQIIIFLFWKAHNLPHKLKT